MYMYIYILMYIHLQAMIALNLAAYSEGFDTHADTLHIAMIPPHFQWDNLDYNNCSFYDPSMNGIDGITKRWKYKSPK